MEGGGAGRSGQRIAPSRREGGWGSAENVYLNVYLSGVDDQRADHGKWGGPKEACHLPSSDECIIPVSEPKVVLHIVAANASDYTTEVVVKVSAAPDEPARPAPGAARATASAPTGCR